MDVASSDLTLVDRSNVTLAILAGGAGRRMGTPKAWLTVGGSPILQCVHDSLRWTGPTMLVTVPERRRPPACELFDRELVDPFEGGPLQSVLTALKHSTTAFTLIIPVDMPGLRSEHLGWFISELRFREDRLGVMSQRQVDHQARIEPLPFCCRSAAATMIADQLRTENRSLHALLDRPEFEAVQSPIDWPVDVWRNLNWPSDL